MFYVDCIPWAYWRRDSQGDNSCGVESHDDVICRVHFQLLWPWQACLFTAAAEESRLWLVLQLLLKHFGFPEKLCQLVVRWY